MEMHRSGAWLCMQDTVENLADLAFRQRCRLLVGGPLPRQSHIQTPFSVLVRFYQLLGGSSPCDGDSGAPVSVPAGPPASNQPGATRWRSSRFETGAPKQHVSTTSRKLEPPIRPVRRAPQAHRHRHHRPSNVAGVPRDAAGHRSCSTAASSFQNLYFRPWVALSLAR